MVIFAITSMLYLLICLSGWPMNNYIIIIMHFCIGIIYNNTSRLLLATMKSLNPYESLIFETLSRTISVGRFENK